MYVCMYRFNSGNSAHKKKSKKAQQTNGQIDKSKLQANQKTHKNP